MFLIERVTPGQLRDHTPAPVDRNLRNSLPFEVEVEDEPVKRDRYESTCHCVSVFRLTNDAVVKLRRNEQYRRGLVGQCNPVVCLCMGRLV